jgi:aspartyl-tRNA(Asn)/glutamyl-tRNA(Gln) amidotransferase subunit A
MSPLDLGTDLAISVRGPAAHTGVVSLKATHGRVPMTGIRPPEPRRFWYVGPMARTIRDLSLAFSQLAAQNGQDGYASNAISFDNGIGSSNKRPLRVGWLVGPGCGPIDGKFDAPNLTGRVNLLKT